MAFPSTTQEYLTYYANTLPAQYRTFPKARDTIKTLAALAIMPQGGNYLTDQNGNALTDATGTYLTDVAIEPILPLALANAFDVTTAVGQQLNFLAELVGCSRTGYTLSGQFVSLSDANFSLLIQAKGAYNRLRGTTQAIQAFVAQYFTGILRVTDNLNMRMTYTLLIPLNSLQWVELFISQGFLPRPLGVNMGSIILGGSYFGMRTYWATAPSWVKPMCTYTAPVATSTPLLLYSESVEA